MESALLVGIGGAAGAISRFLVARHVESEQFPWSTVLVNVLGSFVLGLVLFGIESDVIVLFAGVGFCGAFTTFSSFSVHTVSMWEEGDRTKSAAHAIGTLILAGGAFAAAAFLVG